MNYSVFYNLRGMTAEPYRKATFSHLEEAQLFWDTISYLRDYVVFSPRPL